MHEQQAGRPRQCETVELGRQQLTLDGAPGKAFDAVQAGADHQHRTGIARSDVRHVDTQLLAAGATMKEAASALGLSPRTVETHKYQSMEALGLKTTAELIRYALEHGLTTPSAPHS